MAISKVAVGFGDCHISIYGIYCNYFKEAVLQSDRELYEQIKKINKSK